MKTKKQEEINMINNFVGVGRTTKDVELRYSKNGVAIANFTLAITRRFDKENADFIRCVAFKKTAELLAQYVKKGHQLGIEGSIQTDSYDDKDGKRVYTTEVIVNNMQFLETKGQQNTQQQRVDAYNNTVNQAQGNPFENQGQQIDVTDDSLPF